MRSDVALLNASNCALVELMFVWISQAQVVSWLPQGKWCIWSHLDMMHGEDDMSDTLKSNKTSGNI